MNRSVPSPIDSKPSRRVHDFQRRFRELDRWAKSNVDLKSFTDELFGSLSVDFSGAFVFAALWQFPDRAGRHGQPKFVQGCGIPPSSWQDEQNRVGSASQTHVPRSFSVEDQSRTDKSFFDSLVHTRDETHGRWSLWIEPEGLTGGPWIIELGVKRFPVLAGSPTSERNADSVKDELSFADCCETADELLPAYGLIFEDFLRNRQHGQLQNELHAERTWNRFLTTVHGSLDLEHVAREIVSMTVSITNCRRAIVTLNRQPAASASRPNDPRFRQRVLAVSGVATIDHRSPLVRALASLAQHVAVLGRVVTVPPTSNQHELPPQVTAAIEDYTDQAHCIGLIAIPLIENRSDKDDDETPGLIVGVLIVEYDNTSDWALRLGSANQLASRCPVALRHAATYTGLPLRRASERLHTAITGSRLAGVPAIAWVTAVLILIGLVLVWVPATLRVRCSGTLQPATVQGCFAPRDGEITQVFIEHDDVVSAGDKLLEMHSPDLELELRKIEGAIDSTTEELQAAEAARRQTRSSSSGRDNSGEAIGNAGSLAADEAKLMATLENYREQRKLLMDERERLNIRSPIGGKVLTWDVRQTLRNRPVRRGQRMLRIAAQGSPWVIRLDLPDRNVGHVLKGSATNNSNVATANINAANVNAANIEYVIASQPGRRYTATIARISQITTGGETDAIVEVIGNLTGKLPESLRAGMRVRGEIDCGTTSLGYAWFHELIDAARYRLPF